ncbi:MAG: C1 family peptidase, partial [Alphaproteobacteria bacterium]
EYAADGIIRNVDFALEDSLTCVKSQGFRGSCGAHAVVAGVETAAMASGGGPENLAEQSVYFFGKVGGDWRLRYESGMAVDLALQAMIANGWLFPFESDWNYNQSPGIQDLDPVTNQRPGSCDVAYDGEMCTDYEFQAVERIDLVLGLPTLVEYDFPAAASGSGHAISSWATIPDFDVPPGGPFAALQLETAALLLESGVPVVATIAVPDAFRAPAPGGYIRNVAGQVARGTHAILLVGFVSNADLPAGVTLDAGPLGGYFVAKNSWGTSWADCGFAYLASDFLDAWGSAYQAIEID